MKHIVQKYRLQGNEWARYGMKGCQANSPLVVIDILPKVSNSLETAKINISILLKRDKFYSFVVLFP
jgi:hypothetical protein